MDNFFSDAEYQDSPIRALTNFLKTEREFEAAKQYDKMRFVGYVLDIGFNEATLITSDPFKITVGGVPRGSFLIMAPDSFDGMSPHFSLLRVTDTAPTPLSKEVQQTYFELHKKAMPALDVWTKGELQWGALKTRVLGMFYPDQTDPNTIKFSGDVNNVISAHRYKVYSPNTELQDLIVNSMVEKKHQFAIGTLRLTECLLPFAKFCPQTVKVKVSTNDFKGFRTAMFGKTRLGKSNVVKVIAQSIIETTKNNNTVGQLIFDINGEYANDSDQDGGKSLRSANEDRCKVFALTKNPATPSEPLRLNFYEQPESCKKIIGSLLEKDGKTSIYITSFANSPVPSLDAVNEMPPGGDRNRAVRKIQIYWAILYRAGYGSNEERLKNMGLRGGGQYTPQNFDPHLRQDLISAVYPDGDYAAPANLEQLAAHLERVVAYKRQGVDAEKAFSKDGKNIFDAEDMALLDFLSPTGAGAGPKVLSGYKKYHAPDAGNFEEKILEYLDGGLTVILDLGNANDEIRQYFSDLLSRRVFSHQESKFAENNFKDHYVQLYFEEAHNLFPKDDKDFTGVYTRFAKEGAKFHIGMVYSTQSPSTINKELLAQTENFFVAHMSSQGEADALARLQVQYDGLQQDILYTRSPGYMRIITFSHRFVIPVQVNQFEKMIGNLRGAKS